ncbi:MAG: hypothetical protein LBR58_01340 [Propionibacteriaceae bacterium]|jgi:hypothetical protein|nr:hypothetical protein [Propionibacteriaceae bacterium]
MTSDPGTEEHKTPGHHRTRIIRACGALVAVAMAAVISVFAYQHWDQARPFEIGQARTPTQAVEGYLTALAEGRAADALAFVHGTPYAATYLTDKMLAASQATAPLTSIAVDESASSDDRVHARYAIGTQVVDADFHVLQADTYWYLVSGWVEVEVASTLFEQATALSVTLTLDGEPVSTTDCRTLCEFILFPGYYEFAVEHPLMEVTVPEFTVLGDESKVVQPAVTEPLKLKDTAAEAILAQAEDELTQCLAEHAYQTKCGFGFEGPTIKGFKGESITIDEDTLQWNLDSETAPFTERAPSITASYSRVGADDAKIRIWGSWAGTVSLSPNPSDTDTYYPMGSISYWVDVANPSDVAIHWTYEPSSLR